MTMNVVIHADPVDITRRLTFWNREIVGGKRQEQADPFGSGLLISG
jgi:hypothetical protein